jgi:hypothetical protein
MTIHNSTLLWRRNAFEDVVTEVHRAVPRVFSEVRDTDGHDWYANMKVNYLFLGRCRPARSVNLKRASPYPRDAPRAWGPKEGPPALKGAELCLAHSGQTRLDSAKGAQRSAEVRRAKAEARRETLRDKLARKLEEHADEVVAAYLAGIRSDDPNRAYRAADAWISRVHGRPKETIENVSVWDDPLDIASMTREERDRLKRQLVAANPEAARQLGLTIAS